MLDLDLAGCFSLKASEAELPGVLGGDAHAGVLHDAVAEPAVHHGLLDERRAATGVGRLDHPRGDGGLEQVEQHRRDGSHRGRHLVGMGHSELDRELGDRTAIVERACGVHRSGRTTRANGW